MRAIYRCFDADMRLLYVGQTLDAGRRLSEHANSKSWFPRVARIYVDWVDDADALQAESDAIRLEQPIYNVSQAGGAALTCLRVLAYENRPPRPGELDGLTIALFDERVPLKDLTLRDFEAMAILASRQESGLSLVIAAKAMQRVLLWTGRERLGDPGLARSLWGQEDYDTAARRIRQHIECPEYLLNALRIECVARGFDVPAAAQAVSS